MTDSPVIDRRQVLFVAAWALLTVLVSFAPIWYGYAVAGDGWQFTGFHAGPLNDYQGYRAWMRQAQDGHLMFLDMFTSEPQQRVSVHPLFWLIGSVSRWTGASIMGVWHLVLGLGLALMVVAIYRFCAEFTGSPATRSLALVLATTASGLGWLVPGAGRPVIERPIDLWMEEANQFRVICSSYFTLTLALALMLWVAVRMMRYFRSGRLRDAAWAGLIALLLATLHPYDLVTLYAVLGVWTLLAGRRFWPGMIVMVAISAPYLLYGFLAVRLDPVLSQVPLAMEMPPLSAYLIGWGLPLVLAAVAIVLPKVWRDHRHVRLLLVWVVVNLALLLAPVEFRRKLIWGLHVIFCLLAAMAIREIVSRLTQRLASRPAARTVAGGVFALAAVVFMAIGSAQFLQSQFRDRTFGRFLPDDVVRALDVLDRLTGEDDVVLAGPALAGLVPGWSGATAFWGHWALTVDLARKRTLASRLLAPDSPIDRDVVARILDDHRIRFIVLDRASAEMGAGKPWPVARDRLPIGPFVRPVHRSEWVVILEVLPDLLLAAQS